MTNKDLTRTLQIGNLVHDDELDVVEVVQIKEKSIKISADTMFKDKVVGETRYTFHPSELSPIPMTPEWIGKFGITKVIPMSWEEDWYEFMSGTNQVNVKFDFHEGKSLPDKVLHVVVYSEDGVNVSRFMGNMTVHEFQNFTGIVGRKINELENNHGKEKLY